MHTVKTGSSIRPASARDMNIGDIAETECGVLMRTYDGFVLLDDPSSTWGSGYDTDAVILPVGTTITITIGQGVPPDDAF